VFGNRCGLLMLIFILGLGSFLLVYRVLEWVKLFSLKACFTGCWFVGGLGMRYVGRGFSKYCCVVWHCVVVVCCLFVDGLVRFVVLLL